MTELSRIDHLLALPAEEKLAIVEALWESLAADPASVPVPDWQREEIDRRLDALESGTSVGVAWEEVRRRITTKP